MRTDNKRKQTSRLNALKSAGPKLPEGKRRCLRRQAPAESSLISIQMQRMSREIIKEFATVSPSAIYALQEQGDALNQISRQGRRLLSQFEKLTQQLLTNRQLFPPVAPEPPNLNPHPDLEAQNEPVETNLTEDQQTTTQPTENETVETKPVETKLIDSVTLHLPFPRETRVHNAHSILHDALPPICQPAPTEGTDAPTKVQSAGYF